MGEAMDWNAKAKQDVWVNVGIQRTPKTQVADIIRAVGLRSGFSYKMMLSHTRHQPLIDARHAAVAAVAIAFPWMSTPQIAKAFNRDHSSVIYILQKMGVRSHLSGSYAKRRDARWQKTLVVEQVVGSEVATEGGPALENS